MTTTTEPVEAAAGRPAVWSGAWVADRLDVAIETTAAPLGVALADLVGLAVRRNPRRAHLLVSTVLGKHVPTDPHLVYGSGRLLGTLVSRAVAAAPDAPHPRDRTGGDLLRLALDDVPGAALALVEHTRRAATTAPAGTVVLGYAETATALGHAVADALSAPVLHSTRRPVAGLTPVGGFEEEHSHATSHLLLPEDPAFLDGTGPLVLVDDELSTGNTALNTIAALHRTHPRAHYVIAALVDLRSDADRDRMAQVAHDLGARIDMVALAAGRVALPADVLGRGQELVTAVEATQGTDSAPAEPGTVERVHHTWPTQVRDGGRHGFTPTDEHALASAADGVAADVAALVDAGTSVHVLGFEELMYAPLRLATAVAEQCPEAKVTYSTTTRSPVLAVDDPGYALRSRLVFAAHDHPADGPGDRFAYNVAPPASAPVDRFDTVVLVVDTAADTADLEGAAGLLDALTAVTDRVLLVTLPDYRPTTTSADRPASAPTPGETP